MSKKIEKGFLAKLKSMLLHLKEISTDDGKVIMVDDELEVGKEVLIEVDGEWQPAPDGEYTTEKGIVRVEGGLVTEIRAKDTDDDKSKEEQKQEDLAEQRFHRISAAFSESYEERTKKIASAIYALGFSEYAYIVSCGDDFAIICVYDETGEHYTRFDVSWEGEEVSVSNPTEVVPDFRPVGGEPATGEVEVLRGENEQLKAQVETLKQKLSAPVDPPIGEGKITNEEDKDLAHDIVTRARKRQ